MLPTRNAQFKKDLRRSGLCYVDDRMPGIERRLIREKFKYFLPDGKPLHDADELARIRALAIPPAYTEVWICPLPHGYLQATGRDARGRKQYRYHSQWRLLRDENKYEHMIAFGYALPKIRRRVRQDLKKPLLSRDNMLATIVRLLELTLIRVGNEEYARTNKSFGITTLRNRHVNVIGNRVLFKFRGKSGQAHQITLNDRMLARIVKRCRDLPGQELFQYLDDAGERHSISSSDVNTYLQQITGEDFTAKDFRTWAGTVLAASILGGDQANAIELKTDSKKIVVDAIKTVAIQLGNTPAICRRCYVHPRVIDAYMEGSLAQNIAATSAIAAEPSLRGLYKAERVLLHFLQGSSSQGRAA